MMMGARRLEKEGLGARLALLKLSLGIRPGWMCRGPCPLAFSSTRLFGKRVDLGQGAGRGQGLIVKGMLPFLHRDACGLVWCLSEWSPICALHAHELLGGCVQVKPCVICFVI